MINRHTILFHLKWIFFNLKNSYQWICFNLPKFSCESSIHSQWIYFNPNIQIHIQGPISVCIIHWIHFDPTKFLGIFQPNTCIHIMQYWVCFNPKKFPINMIHGSLSTLNKSNNSTSNSNSTQVYPAPLALPAIAFTTSFYE